jgi:uracil-DNA glycosylase family 4
MRRLREQMDLPFGMSTGKLEFSEPSACERCPLHLTAGRVCILGTGPKRADVMIVGEAPGRREDETGKPFQGQAGALLDEMLLDAGLRRADVYVTNAVHCRPPDNVTPKKKEIVACKSWLDEEIRRVKPKYVLLLGNTPLFSITGEVGIKKKRGKPFEKDGILYLPTYHPAYALRDPRQRAIIERDIRYLKEMIDFGGIPKEERINSVFVDTWAKFKSMCKDIRGSISFDIEGTGLYPWDKDYHVTMIGFGTKTAQYSIPWDHPESPFDSTELEEMLEILEPLLAECYLITQNGKYDYLCMWVKHNVQWHHYAAFDTLIAHYLLDENDLHGLKYLAQKYCGAPDWEIETVEKGSIGPKTVIYHANDLFWTRELRYKFGKMLNEDPGVKRVFQSLMMPVMRLFVDIEYDGVCVDTTKFDAAEAYLREERRTALKALRKWERHREPGEERFNWGSADQLRDLLFSKKKDGGFGLAPLDMTKPSKKHPKGRPSTSESVLLRLDHPCVKDLLRYRAAKQQLSFFIDGWKPFLDVKSFGSFLHPSFKLHGTVTGRPSCEHPNLQQVPRDERIRSLITAPKGWVLIECDLSQIELRIAAELSADPEMLNAFISGVDVHWLTAIREIGRGGGKVREVVDTAHAYLKRKDKKAKQPTYSKALDILLEMGPDTAIEIDKSWKELRKKAKAINFGYLYGMWWKKFKDYARDNYGVTVSDEEAQASREAFFGLYRKLNDFHSKQRRYARRNGYVRTMTGRKRRLPEAQRPENDWIRQGAERQAINSPVQGFAAELNLMVAVQMREEFPRSVLRIGGTVHDAILMWAKEEKATKVTRRCLEMMKRPALFDEFEIDLKVPIEGDAKIGPWSLGVSLKKWEDARAA